jgi:nicotinamidase-related amidase
MKIPNSLRNRALLVIDVQPKFLNDRMSYIAGRIDKLISLAPYSLYVEALFYSEEDSLWKRQSNWSSPKEGNMFTAEPLGSNLQKFNPVQIIKTVRSAFKGDPELLSILHNHRIEEVHLVGLDTYDCITATAHEASDYGFFTYVLEECCQATTSQELHDRAVANLRQTKLTNNSCIEAIDFLELDFS